MKGGRPVEPAPARGRYDRAQSRQARQAEQRERLVIWLAQVYREQGERITVHEVVRAAGVGRNTFYEYFDGLEHGLAYATQSFSKRLHQQLVLQMEGARSGIAKLRILSRAWFDLVESEPAAMSLLARARSTGPMSASAELFQSLLEHAVTEAGSRAAEPREHTCAACAAFAAEGASLYAMRGGGSPGELSEALSIFLTRVFR
jgi:AcrR family transcriptional regulator